MKQVNRLQATAALLVVLSPPPWVFAQTIEIPVASQGKELNDVKRPIKGSSQQQVVNEFGQPLNSLGPTGEPPITRWDYTYFSVYFEHDHVIHSVLKHQSAKK